MSMQDHLFLYSVYMISFFLFISVYFILHSLLIRKKRASENIDSALVHFDFFDFDSGFTTQGGNGSSTVSPVF